MKFFSAVGTVLVFLISCEKWSKFDEDPEDYFPLDVGMYWKYEVGDKLETKEVIKDTVILNQPCKEVTDGVHTVYYAIGDVSIARFVQKDTFLFSRSKILYQGFVKYITMPFKEEKSWADTLRATEEISGETLIFEYIINATVDGKERVAEYEAWKISYEEKELRNGKLVKESEYKIWLAKQIGVVKEQRNGIEKLLVKFGRR